MEELKKLVRELEGKTDKLEMVNQLQKIGKYILNNCYFTFDEDKKIYPLWIEAYYYNEKMFKDDFCHKNEVQRGEGNFGKPYYHSGIDICLPLGDYYLSYLIKVSYDDKGEIYSQTELKKSIKKRKNKDVIHFDHNNRIVDNYYRIGVFANHDMNKLFYQEALLSSYFDLTRINDDVSRQTLDKITIKKGDFVKDYLARHPEAYNGKSKNQINIMIEKLVGYKMHTLFDGDSLKENELPLLYRDFIKSKRR